MTGSGSALLHTPPADGPRGGWPVEPSRAPAQAAARTLLASAPRATPWSDALDLRWLGAFTALVLGLCGAVYLVAALAGPPDLERVGTFWFGRDFSQYQAAMREGARSTSWLIRDRFTAEPHQPILMYPLYVALGKLSAALAGTDDLALTLYTGLEWLGRTAVVVALAAFAGTFLAARRARRLALLLALFTLGLAAWALPLRLATTALSLAQPSDPLPAVNVFLELNSFGVLFAAPHLMLGLALTLLAGPLYLRAAAGRSTRWVLGLNAAVLALGFIHPFNLPVLVSLLLLDSLWRLRRGWTMARPAVLAALLAGASAAPLGLYNLLLFQADPFWAGTYGAQNEMPSPAPWALPGDLGVVLLAAPLAWAAVRAWQPDTRRFLLLWIALDLAWMYVPVPYQRRFAFGIQPALAVLAAAGLLDAGAWLRRIGWGVRRRRLAAYAVALAALLTPMLTYVALLSSAATNAPVAVYAWTRAEAAAGQWFGANARATDVVLASEPFSNALVGVMDGRVVYGHPVATRESARKALLVKRFYERETPADERAALLRESGATLVVLGPQERQLGGSAATFEAMAGLVRVHESQGVQVYRVRETGS